MIISVEKAKELINFNDWTDGKIKMKLDAIEWTIRAYTNNNFQKRAYRTAADIVGGSLLCDIQIPFQVGDTVQISESGLNHGLYVVESIEDLTMEVDEDVVDERNVLVTKIEYPADVIDCAIRLIEWEQKHGGKVGIKSETLSRHSVTYEDSATLFMGYPVGILNGLKLHMKARF